MSEVFLQDVIDRCGNNDKICLLPISRVLVEEASWLSDHIAIFPPNAIKPEVLRVVEWPAPRMNAILKNLRKNGSVIVKDDDLHWAKSAATNIDLPDFFGSALLAFPTELDWRAFLLPESHEAHLEMLRAKMDWCERTMDRVRFDQCNLWTPQLLPGRVGLLENTPYCTGLFYCRDDNESYIIAGEIVTHQLLVGIGTDMYRVFVPPIADGELGNLAIHALRLYSEALEAQSETSRFVQTVSLIEFLADPYNFTKMENIRKYIGRQVANDPADYENIQNDFRYFATERGPVTQPKSGLRHNIVHLGKSIENLITSEERKKLFMRLGRYVGVSIQLMLRNSEKDWEFIKSVRESSKERLGID